MAAFCFAVAATLQQKGALALGVDEEGNRASIAGLAKSRWWLVGTGVLLLGYVLQAIALDNGRLSIIQPLLVTTVVWALPLGYLVTNQSVGRREIGGAVIVVFGLALYAIYGDPAAGNDSAPNNEWAAALLIVTAFCALLLVLGRRSDALRKATYLGIMSGILYGTSACMVKEVTTQLDAGGVSEVLTHWEFWGMAASGVIAFVVQQMSLREGFLATSVATVSVANPIVSVLIGIILFEETLSDPASHKLIAWIGLGLGLFGAIMISTAGSGEKDVGAVELDEAASAGAVPTTG